MNPEPAPKRKIRVILATTATLNFITYWKGAALVLCDLASTVYYIGGISEQAIGKAAPWFILGVMLFSYAVRALYMESCSLFVRGGVYRVVKEAEHAIFGNHLGGITAKLSVSMLMFDYVLTGPISALAAGHYLVTLVNTLLPMAHILWHLPETLFAVLFALWIILYFWWQNIKGVPESSDKALKIMMFTTVMGVILIVWSIMTLRVRGFEMPPITPVFSKEAWGWLGKYKGTIAPLSVIGLFMAFGHTLLAMSGEESLAQVYRELEAPKLKNLKKAAFIIFLYSLLLTSLVSFFAVMIIPDSVRISQYSENLLSGLTMYLVGPYTLRLIFQGFVVFVGFLILSGAANTSIIGANGVLARVGEDGVLPDWARRPHPRFGTSYRLINLTVGLQVITLFLSGGNVYILGEAYAFGVIWSFVFKAMAIIILRFYDKSPREYRVPFNLKIGPVEIPLGLATIFAILFMTAGVNLFTKQMATISGSLFALAFFIVFTVSERINKQRHGHYIPEDQTLTEHGYVDKVNLDQVETLTAEACGATKPNRILVAVRNPRNMVQLQHVLRKTNSDTTDVLVLTSKVGRGYLLEGDLTQTTQEEEVLFTQIISVAEKEGHTVIPLMVASNDPFYAMAKVAYDLDIQELVVGKSEKDSLDIQMERIALAWGAVRSASGRSLLIRIIWAGSEFKEEIV